jgi:hypothetical protein
MPLIMYGVSSSTIGPADDGPTGLRGVFSISDAAAFSLRAVVLQGTGRLGRDHLMLLDALASACALDGHLRLIAGAIEQHGEVWVRWL